MEALEDCCNGSCGRRICSVWDVHWQSELDVCGMEACDVFWMMVCVFLTDLLPEKYDRMCC